MFWLIFTAIYIISFALHIVIIYLECKKYIYTIGDIIDEIEFCTWFPILNTLALVSWVIFFGFRYIFRIKILKNLWENFRNIKIKK